MKKIVTPEILKSILVSIINHLKDEKLKIQSVKNVISVTENKTSIAIGITGFNKNKNVLQVFKDGKLMKDSEYTISDDSINITGTFNGATTTTPVEYQFICFKVSL